MLSNEPKMNHHTLPLSPQRGSKNATDCFLPISLGISKSATKLLYAKTVSGRVVRHLLAYLSVHM